MSTIFPELVTIDTVTPHPNADRLEIVRVKGATVASQKDTFHPGERAVYFPPDTLLPEDQAERLGVRSYLKHAHFDPASPKSQCRVAACRLRGQPSYGFLAPLSSLPDGADLSSAYRSRKYEPPVREGAGEMAPEVGAFHRYTSIENYWRHPDAIPAGTEVRITEKIHGTNSRVGHCVNREGNWELMAGSHKTVRKSGEGLYWLPFEMVPRLEEMVRYLSKDGDPVVVFGEIFGPGIQDLDYGRARSEYRVFDISVGGSYLDWPAVEVHCTHFDVPLVPLLYSGPFDPSLIDEHTHGPTTLADAKSIRSPFKGREGIVITPLIEQPAGLLGGRLILKSVSADYHDRKGAQDNE